MKDLSLWLNETEIKDLWNQLYNLSLQMPARGTRIPAISQKHRADPFVTTFFKISI